MTADWVLAGVAEYERVDDVFDSAFLATVILTGAKKADVEITDDAEECFAELGNKQAMFVPSPKLLPGPYVLVGQELRDVWKLVDDFNGTCMATLKPQSR